jgi:hypothetical protein
MGTSIHCRLGFLISPNAALIGSLQIDPAGDCGICEPVTVITPQLDYEEAFEGWKRAWKSKAKQDFIAEIVDLYSDDFPAFTDELRNRSVDEAFDRWWTLSELSVLEIDPTWRPA